MVQAIFSFGSGILWPVHLVISYASPSKLMLWQHCGMIHAHCVADVVSNWRPPNSFLAKTDVGQLPVWRCCRIHR